MTRSLTTRTTAVAALATALALATPLTASAAQNQGGGSGQVICQGKGGGKAGEKVTETVYIRLRGKIIHESKWTYICGNDGQWHVVA